jgi:UDP-N-acetylmuramoyl-tripeptide--D-alanyl-D-alanine ligase
MGAYSPGGIKFLANIAQPKIGILTGINEQHLATFGSQEKIIKTKYELIEFLPNEGLAVFNGDNYYCRHLYENTKIAKRIVFSEIPKDFPVIKYWMWRDLWAEDIQVEKEYLEFKLCSKDKKIPLKVNLLGKHNIPNLLMAAVVARRLGLELEEVIEKIKKIKPDLSPLKLIKTKTGLNIIDSSYSANPNGVIADLEYLKVWKGKKAIIMPCLIELGERAKEVHFRIGQKIGEVCDLAIITTKDCFKEIQKGAESKGMERNKVVFLNQPRKILEKTKNFRGGENIILLEGRIKEEIKEILKK